MGIKDTYIHTHTHCKASLPDHLHRPTTSVYRSLYLGPKDSPYGYSNSLNEPFKVGVPWAVDLERFYCIHFKWSFYGGNRSVQVIRISSWAIVWDPNKVIDIAECRSLEVVGCRGFIYAVKLLTDHLQKPTTITPLYRPLYFGPK